MIRLLTSSAEVATSTVEAIRSGGKEAMRIGLADDGALFRDGLELLLQAAGHDVVGAVADGDALIALSHEEPMDVVLVDIRMPPGEEGGLTAALKLREESPSTAIVMLSHYAESHYLMRVLAIGTERIGYRLKEKVAGVGPLADTLERVAAGEIVIEPEVAARLITGARPDEGALGGLNERELEVLRLMAEGRSNTSIAGQMFVSVKAVEKYTAAIFMKLGLPDDARAHHRRVLAVLAFLRGKAGA